MLDTFDTTSVVASVIADKLLISKFEDAEDTAEILLKIFELFWALDDEELSELSVYNRTMLK